MKAIVDEIFRKSNIVKKYMVKRLHHIFTIIDIKYENDNEFYFVHVVNGIYGINKIFSISKNFIFDGTNSTNWVNNQETQNWFKSVNKKYTLIKFGYLFKIRN